MRFNFSRPSRNKRLLKAISNSIAAASIIAKVTRDEMMVEYNKNIQIWFRK